MNTLLLTLLEILKYTLPSAVMLIITYMIVSKFLVSELQRKQLALLHDSQNVTLPLRLQAYERLALFTECIQTRQIMPRVFVTGMNVGELRAALVLTINAEWEHNLTQQIYVSRQVWETVKHMREQELALIHGLAGQLAAEAPGKELQVRLADYLGEADGEAPGAIALAVIAGEAKRVLSLAQVSKIMKIFFQLNKHKLAPLFTRLSIVFTTLVVVVFTIAFSQDATPAGTLLITILVFAGIIFPVFIMFLGVIAWQVEQSRMQKIFNRQPLIQFEILGFQKTLLNQDYKWNFTEEAVKGFVNNIYIRWQLNKNEDIYFFAPKIIELKALVAPATKIPRSVHRPLLSVWKQQNIFPDWTGIIRRFELKDVAALSPGQLRIKILRSISVLKTADFVPVPDKDHVG